MSNWQAMDKSTPLSSEWFRAAWQDESVPLPLQRLVERLCVSYGIKGQCDVMYIANVTAKELGFGDGQGHFGDDWAQTLQQLKALEA